MIPTAQDMAEAIRSNTHKLADEGVLEESSRQAAERLYSILKSKRDSQAWEIVVPREEGFVFAPLAENDIVYQPTVSVKGIHTDPESPKCFARLDISLQLASVDTDHYARWHFDMANKQPDQVYQDGPLFHLQFGGHSPGRDNFWLPLPRWAHAPMDLILLLEAVTANFYPKQWNNLREDVGWCEHVSQSEVLCFSEYVANITKLMQVRSRTVLGDLWANPSAK